MGNSLLDFVMALVRDPQAAARYAADPAGALAEAHLPGVTITDVANLIPVVSDSLATATPDFGSVADTANVWTSSAAAAAFDAFDIPHPAPAAWPESPQITSLPVEHSPVIPDTAGPESAAGAPVVDAPLEPPPASESFDVDRVGDDAAWPLSHDPRVDDHHPADHPGFDLF